MQPGQTITPGNVPENPQTPEVSNTTAPSPQATQSPVQTAQPVQAVIESQPLPQQLVETSPDEAPTQTHVDNDVSEVAWTASEYIAHDKSMNWFVMLGLGLAVLLAVVYLLTKDIFVSVLVALAGITFGVFAARPPRVLRYAIDSKGVTIGERTFPFNDFKSFTVSDEGAVPSLMLMPLKRFLPPITIFYDPQNEDAIFDTLANYLPHEDKEPDFVDRLMGRIRF